MPRTSGDIACLAAERLRRSVCASPFIVAGQQSELEVTVSIGVACTGDGEDTVETLLKRADEAVYEAKAAGRNRVVGKSASRAA
jgi:two-component system cell cycle response regulator